MGKELNMLFKDYWKVIGKPQKDFKITITQNCGFLQVKAPKQVNHLTQCPLHMTEAIQQLAFVIG